MAQLHCNIWSDIADYLTLLRRLPVRMEISACSVIKVVEDFTKISNLVVNPEQVFFSSEFLIQIETVC